MSETLTQLAALYGDLPDGLRGLLWFVSWGDEKHSRPFRDPEEGAALVAGFGPGVNAYCHIGLARAKDCHLFTHGKRLSAAPGTDKLGKPKIPVAAIAAFGGDLDFLREDKPGCPPDEAAALGILDAMPLRPSVLVASGHGIQPFWIFKERPVFAAEDDRDMIALLSAAWQRLLVATAAAQGYTIDSVGDLARILRVAGSMNVKFPAEPVPVELRYADGPQVNVEDLWHLPELCRHLEAEAASRAPAAAPTTTTAATAQERRYGLGALSSEAAKLAGTPYGARNNAARDAAFRMGRYVGGGLLDEGEVLQALQASVASWKVDKRAVAKTSDTMTRALAAGRLVPKGAPSPTVPDRPQGSADDLATAHVGGGPVNVNDSAGEAVEEAPPARPDMIWTSADVLAGKVADVSWLWQDWLPLGFITILAAAAGDGKSALALDLANRLLQGFEWPTAEEDGEAPRVVRPPSAAPVLVLDCEGCQAIWCSRIRAWKVPAEMILFPGDGLQRVALDDQEALAGIRGTVQRYGVKLLVIDSLRAGLPAGVDENDSNIGAILAPWADLARDCELAIWANHHFGKARRGEGGAASLDRLRGSTAIGAAARSVIAVDRPQAEGREEDPAMRLSVVKSNLGPFPPPLGFVVGADGVEWCKAPEPPKDRHAPARGKAREFLEGALQKQPLPVSELMDRAAQEGIGRDALYRAKGQLRIADVEDPDDPFRRRRLWGLPAAKGRSG